MRYLSGGKNCLYFLLIGLFFAWIEEFITQIIAPLGLPMAAAGKPGWAVQLLQITTLFIAFLIIALILGWLTDKLIRWRYEPLVYYVIIGAFGVWIELNIVGGGIGGGAGFLGLFGLITLFSWYGTVGFAPRFILDKREQFDDLKKKFWKKFKLFMALAYIGIGGAVITSILAGGGKHPENALQLMIILTITLAFVPLNYYYYKYFKGVAQTYDKATTKPLKNKTTKSV